MAKSKAAKRRGRQAALSTQVKLGLIAVGAVSLGIVIGLALRPSAPERTAARAPVEPASRLAAPDTLTPPPKPPEPVREAALPPAPPSPPAAQPQPQGGLPPWQRYAIPTPVFDGRPRIALVIDDVGVDRRRSARAIGLPPQVTLAFLPYPDDVAAQAARARAAGHELLVHLPMQPDDLAHNDPGPNALLVGLSATELHRRLVWDLDRFGDYVGVNNHMGSRFTSNVALMEPLLEELKSRGLLFLDSRTSPASVGAGLAERLGIPTTTRDIFLDNDDHTDKVTAELAVLERVARRQGHAVAIGHPHEGTLDALDHWLPTLAARGFVLVPLTAVVTHPANG